MIHHLNTLSISEKLYESMQSSGNDLRFAAIESNLAEYTRNYAAWHWHEYVEFAYVVEGVVDCITPRQSLSLRQGEGYFVNAGVLHSNRMGAGRSSARFRILQFDTALLCCAGIIAGQYVQPIEKAPGLECLAFAPDDPAHRALLADMRALFDVAELEGEGYPLRVMQLLYALWLKLYTLVKPDPAASASVSDSRSSRIKAMLAFIHTHYAEDIGVADICSAAHVSQREGHRTFRQVLGTTPGAYLQQHRVDCACRLLTETGSTVTQIGTACGFSSPNYFCMAFKEMTGLSPRDFRKRALTAPDSAPSSS